jgi:hypothetical protein
MMTSSSFVVQLPHRAKHRCHRVVVHHLRPSWWLSHHTAMLLAVAVVGCRCLALVPRRPFHCHIADSGVAPICAA